MNTTCKEALQTSADSVSRLEHQEFWPRLQPLFPGSSTKRFGIDQVFSPDQERFSLLLEVQEQTFEPLRMFSQEFEPFPVEVGAFSKAKTVSLGMTQLFAMNRRWHM